MLIHRKLPNDAVVKWAWINIFRVGLVTKYELQLSLEADSFHNLPKGRGTVALDLRWKVLRDDSDALNHGEGAIRVAHAIDDRGLEESFILKNETLRAIQYADHLRTIGDKLFNDVRSTLVTWLKSKEAENTPSWVRDETITMPHWRSHSRLAVVAGKWAAELFPDRNELEVIWQAWKAARLATANAKEFVIKLPPGGTTSSNRKQREKVISEEWSRPKQERFKAASDLFAPEHEIASWLISYGIVDRTKQIVLYLEFWRRKNRHLYQWQCNQRHKKLGWRDDLYHQWAAKLGKTYETVLVLKSDFAQKVRRAKPEDDKEVPQRIRFLRRTIATGYFRSALTAALGKERVIHMALDIPKPIEEEQANGSAQEHGICKALLNHYFDSYGVAAE